MLSPTTLVPLLGWIQDNTKVGGGGLSVNMSHFGGHGHAIPAKFEIVGLEIW